MHRFRWLFYLFGLIGVGLLAGSFYAYQHTASFIDAALTAEGEVIDLARSTSSGSGSSSGGSTYAPVVLFTAANGESYEFTSSASSNPPSYRPGDRVRVYYLAEDPYDAEVDGLFSLWGSVLILGILGTVFSAFGIGPLVPSYLSRRSKAHLLRQGRPVQVRIQGVEQRRNIRVGGRSPWRITAQWQNPRTAEIHIFTSENIWFDPSEHIGRDQVTVYVDPDKPKRHYMDISFLPKLAD
jgi:hypothetical protein